MEHRLHGFLAIASRCGDTRRFFRFSIDAAFRENGVAFPAQHDALLDPFMSRHVGDVLAFEHDLAHDGDPFPAFSLFLDFHIQDKPGDGVHQGGFAGAVGADDRDDLTALDLHAEIVERQGVFIENHQVANFQHDLSFRLGTQVGLFHLFRSP